MFPFDDVIMCFKRDYQLIWCVRKLLFIILLSNPINLFTYLAYNLADQLFWSIIHVQTLQKISVPQCYRRMIPAVSFIKREHSCCALFWHGRIMDSEWICMVSLPVNQDCFNGTGTISILPFVMGIHWSPVDSRHKDQWRGASMFSLICAWTNGWVNTRDAGDLRHNRAHYAATVMKLGILTP